MITGSLVVLWPPLTGGQLYFLRFPISLILVKASSMRGYFLLFQRHWRLVYWPQGCSVFEIPSDLQLVFFDHIWFMLLPFLSDFLHRDQCRWGITSHYHGGYCILSAQVFHKRCWIEWYFHFHATHHANVRIYFLVDIQSLAILMIS